MASYFTIRAHPRPFSLSNLGLCNGTKTIASHTGHSSDNERRTGDRSRPQHKWPRDERPCHKWISYERPCERSSKHGGRRQRGIAREHLPLRAKSNRYALRPLHTRTSTHVTNLTLLSRLRPHNPSPSLPLLHAPPPPALQLPLLSLLPPRRNGRVGRSKIPPINPFRRSSRHDNRPMHHNLPARIPRDSKTSILDGIPNADKPRFRIALSAYVCHALYGRPGGVA